MIAVPTPITGRRTRDSFSGGAGTGTGSLEASLSWSGSWWSKDFPVDNDQDFLKEDRDIGDEFCRDFICCGVKLCDLYELQQHYEEHHVQFDEHEDPSLADLLSDDAATAAVTAANRTLSSSPRINNISHRHNQLDQQGSKNNTTQQLDNNRLGDTDMTVASAISASSSSSSSASPVHHASLPDQNPDRYALKHDISTPLTRGYSCNDSSTYNNNGIRMDLRGSAQPNLARLRATLNMSDVMESLDTLDAVSAFDTQILRLRPAKRNISSTLHPGGISLGVQSFAGYIPGASLASDPSQQHIHHTSPLDSPDSSLPSTPISLADIDVFSQQSAPLASSGILGNHNSVLGNASALHSSSVQKFLHRDFQAPAAKKRLIGESQLSISSPGMMAGTTASEASNGISPEATLAVEKPYKCKNHGCDKAYKNMNGLKYHRLHGACNQNNILSMSNRGCNSGLYLNSACSVSGTQPADLSKRNSDDDGDIELSPSDLASPLHMNISGTASVSSTTCLAEDKKYCCEKCNKRYKNLNGLKYHMRHSHQEPELMVSTPTLSSSTFSLPLIPTPTKISTTLNPESSLNTNHNPDAVATPPFIELSAPTSPSSSFTTIQHTQTWLETQHALPMMAV